ncbi:MAG: type IV toxin-antitoxin system AbiEi family antitoxin domain-containing protein [Gordonia sp. (in: high G+C Gram-positive bacteria)]
MEPFPWDPDGLLRVSDAQTLGVDPRRVYDAERQGRVMGVARGVYALPSERRPESVHRLEVLAARITADEVVSHTSAAVLHRLSMLQPDLSRLHLTTVGSDRGYRRRTRHVHPGPLAGAEIGQVGGIRATTLERTAYDVARSSRIGFAGALSVFDSALRGGADRRVIETLCLRRQAGVATARNAIRWADPLSENPGESWGRAQLIAGGVRAPVLQHEVLDEYGLVVARLDYAWDDDEGQVRLAGEFDGLSKYVDHTRRGETPQDVLRREKERESMLQDLGIAVVRWNWADLRAGRVAPRVSGALRRLRLV